MRLFTFAFAWAWSVIAGALGLYSLVKSNQEKASVKAQAASISRTIHVNIDTHDVFSAGLSATIGAGFVSIIALSFLSRAVIWKAIPLTRRAHIIESALFTFAAVWIIASLIPYTVFVANRSAKVTAFNGSVPVPPAVVEQTMQRFHNSPVYSGKSYLRLFGIGAWIAALSTVIAACASFAAIPAKSAKYNDKFSSSLTVTAEVGDHPLNKLDDV